jgi:hypothetical protein
MTINVPAQPGYFLGAHQGLAPAQPDLKASAYSTGGQLKTAHTQKHRRHPPAAQRREKRTAATTPNTATIAAAQMRESPT